MTTNPAMISTPTLVLTIGSGLVPAAADVQRIFFQSDVRRRATTRFLGLDFRARQPELTEVAVTERGKHTATLPRHQVIEMTQVNADAIQNGIRSVLHDLRSHEKLIEVGLGGKTHLPLDVMILADLAECESAALAPLLPSIYSLLTDEPYAKVHLLLSIAAFSENAQEGTNAHESLKAICGILEDRKQPCLPQVYIFDRYKEGVWEVHDRDELHIILGNFVLALLTGGLAQRLAHQVAQLDVTENQAYFCGASATALIFDVVQLQKACAMRLGAEILGMEFHSKIIPDPVRVEELADDFALKHANPRTWTARLCRDSLFHSTGEAGIEIHFADLRFEDVPMEDWSKTIQAYDANFKERLVPAQTDLFLRNAGGLNDEFHEQMSLLVHALPQQPRLYPGGISAAREVLTRIQTGIQEVNYVSQDVMAIENNCNEQISASLEKLDRAVQSLPKPPAWVLRLPLFLKKHAIHLFNLLYLYGELGTLTDLRQNSVRLVEQKYERLMGEIILQKLNELAAGWVAALEKHGRSLRKLQSALNKLQVEFNERTMQLISSPSLFRLSALDESVLSWAYYYGKRPQDGFRHALLGEHGFLAEWQKASGQTFQERLERFCSEVYEPLSRTDLEEVLHHRDGRDAGFLARSMMQGSVPLLRPNFDQTGGGSSFQMRFLQCKGPSSSSLFPTFRHDEQEWEYISTDDLLLATCCRVRMMIPRTALAHIFERGNSRGSTP